MNILLTNDDGYKAPGIYALAKRLEKNHKITIVAPKVEHSGMSHSITLRKPLVIEREHLEGISAPIYSVQGTPADCVRVALSQILHEKIDLVISGCNLGYNAGMDILYSGTVSACAEANLYKIPALAVSAQMFRKFDADFEKAGDIALDIFERVKEDLVKEVITLNVNIPYAMGQPKAPVLCRIGEPMYDKYDKIPIDESTFELKLVGRNRGRYEEGTDRYYLEEGHTTMTPVKYEFNKEVLLSKWQKIWTEVGEKKETVDGSK